MVKERSERMRDYIWWKSQKKRVRKKYTLVLDYLSPKEKRIAYKWYKIGDFDKFRRIAMHGTK